MHTSIAKVVELQCCKWAYSVNGFGNECSLVIQSVVPKWATRKKWSFCSFHRKLSRKERTSNRHTDWLCEGVTANNTGEEWRPESAKVTATRSGDDISAGDCFWKRDSLQGRAGSLRSSSLSWRRWKTWTSIVHVVELCCQNELTSKYLCKPFHHKLDFVKVIASSKRFPDAKSVMDQNVPCRSHFTSKKCFSLMHVQLLSVYQNVSIELGPTQGKGEKTEMEWLWTFNRSMIKKIYQHQEAFAQPFFFLLLLSTFTALPSTVRFFLSFLPLLRFWSAISASFLKYRVWS